MNFNQSWNSNRGRSRGNRGCGRGRRGGANMHYRGGPTYHRAAPPLLNTPDPYYSLPRFRGTQESFGHLYCHPLNQEPSWPLVRNRPPYSSNPRQAYLPATRVQPQLSSRSTSPLPGTEEYMQRNICEKSAFLKRELELEGSCLNNALNNFDLSDGDYQSDNTNNNFYNNTYRKADGEEEDDKSSQLNENSPSPRRNKKQRQLSQKIMSVEEIHEKIINHISNLSHGKKMNLVNLPGPSGYDIAIQEITRQKRMELSKALRDICNDKFKEIEDSSQVINSIIPDFDIKIEELPRELVEQLSSTLNENVTERIHNMCIDPELMFQQAAEMLNNSLDLEKNVAENDIDKVDFSYPTFSGVDEHGRMDLQLQNIENSNLSMTIEDSMGQSNMLNFANSDQSTPINFDTTQSLNFNMTTPVNYLDTQSCSSSFDMDFSQNATTNTNHMQDSGLFINKSKPDVNIYSPGHVSDNSNFRGISEHQNLDNIDPAFDLNMIDMHEPADILLPPNRDEVNATQSNASDLLSEEVELAACLEQTDPGSNISKDTESIKEAILPTENNDFSAIIQAEDKSLLGINESQHQQTLKESEINPLLKTSTSNSNNNFDNSPRQDTCTVNFKNILQPEDTSRKKTEDKLDPSPFEKSRSNTNSPLRSKDKSQLSDVKSSEEKANTENVSKARHDVASKKKDKKSKSKVKDGESPKKVFEDEQQEKRSIDKKSKTKYTEDDLSRKSTEKDEFHDRSDRKHWDRYSSGECSKDYTEDDLVERRRQDRRQDEKKPKGKYDDDYYKSDKYDRNKCDSYTESYDDNYRKKYSSIDDDKHRRSDPYHYSKYPIDIDEGRNSKRYYQDKLSSYPHRQDYNYHKYDYSMPSDYYQRQDYSYPAEEYHHSKSHRSKYKKHAKKHKRHRDHSSGSNASSSGSEKNSSTSLSYKTKYAAKPADVCDSPDDSSASRHPKTSLKERIQVLCDTKMLNFNPELISPKIVDDSEQVLSADNLKNGPLVNDVAENVVETPLCEDILVDDIPDIAKVTSDDEDLKGPSEIEALECKKYSQRPWKSPGEKKFMMEHLNQNTAPEEDDCKVDIELNVIEKGDIIEYRSKEIFDKATACYEPLQISQETNCVKTESNVPDEKQLDKESELNQSNIHERNVMNSMEVSSTPEIKGLNLEIKLEDELTVAVVENVNIDVLLKNDIEWATTYTQTDLEKEHSPKKNKKDSVKDKARDTSKEKIKSKQNCFTQTAIVSSNAYTQTHKATDILKHKLTQTDVRGGDLKDLQKPETLESISKSLRRKRCIERMFEIDKEIDKLIKERQAFYNLLSCDGDGQKEPEVAASTASELDEPKQKPVVKERTKNSRETKALNVETNKQRQSISKQHVSKQPPVSSKKIAEAASESNEHNLQEKSKLKRGRPKRTQDTPVMEMQKIEEIFPESNKKAHIKEETVKEPTKPKSSSKESSRKRKNREKGPEEHSKSTKVDMSSSKRHKSEAQTVEKETKPIVEKAIEIKGVETESSETATVASPSKSRKKDKKQEIEKKIEPVDDVNVIEKVPEVNAIEPERECSSEVATVPMKEENTDSKLNGNTTSEAQLPPPIVELPVIKEPTTAVISEISSYMKKKKRRLSGILDYRKKKKKSRNKNKKLVPVINSEMFSVKSAVNVTRFSLTQLEEMREEIRSKKIGNETDPCESNADLPQNTDATNSVDSNVVMNENENAKETKMEIEDRDALSESNAHQPQDNAIEFKNFNGAILVIKVVDSIVLAASDKGQLLYFDIDNGTLIETIDVSQTAVTSLVVTKTNEENFIYAGSLDTRLTFVNFDSKSIIKQETLTEPIQCMESSWGFIFVGSDRGSIIRFDLSLDKVADSLKVSNSNILTIKAFQEGPRKVLIVAMRNSPVCVRDAISGLLLRTMQTSFLPTVYTLLIDKNLIYCGTSQHDILVYTFEDGKLVFQHEATKSKGVVCMQIVGNLLLAGCYNGNIYVYNIINNGYLGTMNGPGGLMLSMEIVKNKVIVGTKSSNFQAWNIPQEFVDQM